MITGSIEVIEYYSVRILIKPNPFRECRDYTLTVGFLLPSLYGTTIHDP